jgi:hypothetical protein
MCVGVAVLLLIAACDPDDAHPRRHADASASLRDTGIATIDDAAAPEDATVDGSALVPTVHIDSTCDPDVDHCEQSEDLGLRDGRGYGRGVALVDVDGDGWTDIWRSESGSPDDPLPLRSGLYRNMGDGTFEPWDVGIAEEHLDMNWAGLFGDIDGDGAPDLVLLNGGYEGAGSLAVYQNDVEGSGNFIDVTQEAGVTSGPAAWWSGAFGDYDGDGHLDLVVAAREHHDLPARILLYRNDGTGSFREVSSEVGLPQPTGDVKNPIWIDYDRDGDLDLIISRILPITGEDTGLFENRGDEGFVPVDRSIFPGDIESTQYGLAFAVAVADFDQDGWDDVYLGRWSDQDHLLRNRGDGTFEAMGAEIGIDAPPELNTMGLGVGDLTGNGYPDVFVGPGTPSIDQPPVVYCNVGHELRFERCGEEFREAVPLARWHGVAFGDLNRDFTTDVVVNLGGFATYDRDTGEDTADWLTIFINHDEPEAHAARVRVSATASTNPAVGAQLRLDAERPVYRTVHSAQGFQSINDEWMVLPMGDAETAEASVQWPSGTIETFRVQAWTETDLAEGTGTATDESLLNDGLL